MVRIRRTRIIDALDLKLIEAFRDDARRSFFLVGKSLGVTRITVRERLGRLLKQGYVKLVPIAFPRQFGFEHEVEVHLNIESRHAVDFAEALSADPAVRRLVLVSGAFDVIFTAVFREVDQLAAFLRRIALSPGVRSMQTQHVLQTYRSEHEWFPTSISASGVSSPSSDDSAFPTVDMAGIPLDPELLSRTQVVAQWLAAMAEGNEQTLLDRSTDEIVYERLPPNPYPGRYVGKAAVRQYVREMDRRFVLRGTRIVYAAWACKPDEIIVHWTGSGVDAEGRVWLGLQAGHICVLDGLVSKIVHDFQSIGRSPGTDQSQPKDANASNDKK